MANKRIIYVGGLAEEVDEKVKAVNCHCCTRKCEDKCKYGFPRFPLKDTLVIDKHEIDDIVEDPGHNDKTKINCKKILFDVQAILEDEEKIGQIFEKYPIKGSTKTENHKFRAQRIDELLRLAGAVS